MAGLFCGMNKNVLKFIIVKVAKLGENSLNKVAFFVKFKIGQLSSELNLNKAINKNKGVLDVLRDQNLVHKDTRIAKPGCVGAQSGALIPLAPQHYYRADLVLHLADLVLSLWSVASCYFSFSVDMKAQERGWTDVSGVKGTS